MLKEVIAHIQFL